MASDQIRRVGVEIDIDESLDFSALELREMMHRAGIGLSRQTLQRYLEEAVFDGLIAPIKWKPGKGRAQPDKSIFLNVALWKRGVHFNEIVGNGTITKGGDVVGGSPADEH
jgi:hypothetical protein